MKPPEKALVSIVRRVLLLSAVGVEPATVQEFAWMLVTAEPIDKLPVPDPMVTAPSLVVVPKLADRAALAAPLAISVRACEPAVVPSIVPPKAIEPPENALVSIVRRAVLLRVVGTDPATVKEFA